MFPQAAWPRYSDAHAAAVGAAGRGSVALVVGPGVRRVDVEEDVDEEV